MIKTFYRYEFGFINLDSNNLYLTSSGNWSEAKKLEEKSTRVAVREKYYQPGSGFSLLLLQPH